jgi:hypothetical protein
LADAPATDGFTRPAAWLAGAVVLSLMVGLFASKPAESAFVVSAKTRSLTMEWPCPGKVIDWTLPAGPGEGARYRTAGKPDYAPLGAKGSPGKVQLLPGALAEIALGPGGTLQIVIRRSARAGEPGTAIAEVFPAEGDSVGVDDELYITVPPGTEPLALPVRGLIKLGGVLLDGDDGSAILEGASIMARGEPFLADETRTFLTEQVGPGSLIYSHPELIPVPGGARMRLPRKGWGDWCSATGGTPARQAVGLLQFKGGGADKAGDPLDVAYIRHGPAVGLQTLGAAVPDDGDIVRLSVTKWAFLLQSAWMQTAFVVLAALLTALNYLYATADKPLRLGLGLPRKWWGAPRQ